MDSLKIRIKSLENRHKALSNLVLLWLVSDKLSPWLKEFLAYVL